MLKPKQYIGLKCPISSFKIGSDIRLWFPRLAPHDRQLRQQMHGLMQHLGFM